MFERFQNFLIKTAAAPQTKSKNIAQKRKIQISVQLSSFLANFTHVTQLRYPCNWLLSNKHSMFWKFQSQSLPVSVMVTSQFHRKNWMGTKHGRSQDFFRGGNTFSKKISKNFQKIFKKFSKKFLYKNAKNWFFEHIFQKS